MYLHDYSCWRPRPSQNDFELEVVSQHPDTANRPLKKYSVEGINTIGVFGDEPFEVHFKNKSFEDVQVRISLDGTDTLTGKPADLEMNHTMWLVRAGNTLHLKAWAENNAGGARFVFTSGDKGVSLNAHGDISHKGIISAAVFTERDKPQSVMRGQVTNSSREFSGRRSRISSIGSAKGGSMYSQNGAAGMTLNSSAPSAPAAAGEFNISDARSENKDLSFDLKREAAVGAGEFVAQKTKTVKGLDSPVLNSIVRVRYMWWDDIQAKLKENRQEDPYPTGFPAEKIKTFADLSGVPRVISAAARTESTKSVKDPGYFTKITQPNFDRVL